MEPLFAIITFVLLAVGTWALAKHNAALYKTISGITVAVLVSIFSWGLGYTSALNHAENAMTHNTEVIGNIMFFIAIYILILIFITLFQLIPSSSNRNSTDET